MLLIRKTGLPIQTILGRRARCATEPLGLLQVVADYLMQDPSDNPVMLPDLGSVLSNWRAARGRLSH